MKVTLMDLIGVLDVGVSSMSLDTCQCQGGNTAVSWWNQIWIWNKRFQRKIGARWLV